MRRVEGVVRAIQRPVAPAIARQLQEENPQHSCVLAPFRHLPLIEGVPA
jgi:hypothetical protein